MDRMTAPELAVSAVTPKPLGWLAAAPDERLAHWREVLEDDALAAWIAPLAPTHLYIGSEFCEYLMPSPRTLDQALELAADAGLRPVLLTPIAAPATLRELAGLLPRLPDTAEIVVNDWGVARFLLEARPELPRAAGRLLCRVLKDPRLSGPEWAHQCRHSLDSQPLRALLARLGLGRIEIDVPLLAESDSLADLPAGAGVHLPYSYVAKGRMCRPGALARRGPERFAPGRPCQKECLSFSAATARAGADGDAGTRHVGNTVFGRHRHAVGEALREAVAAGRIGRLIVPGERL